MIPNFTRGRGEAEGGRGTIGIAAYLGASTHGIFLKGVGIAFL